MDVLKQMDFAVEKTLKNCKIFKVSFPQPQSNHYVYQGEPCIEWTSGFFPGMEMLAYEYTNNKEFLECAKHHAKIFRNRIDNKIYLDHHDLGFLYTPSCVSLYKVTGDEFAKETALLAADHLMARYNEKGGFIQAWGSMDETCENRLIIDCLLNIPLLFWASEVTGNNRYFDVAKTHLYTALKVSVREDNTTYHTYFFDKQNGTPLYGKTAQGFSDDSCWARGQAWAIYGTALAYKYLGDATIIDYFRRVTTEFINRLPEDYVPYWDMIFKDGSKEPRDTSSAAIAACGILEMSKYTDCTNFLEYVEKMLHSLSEKYTSKRLTNSNAILTDAMYSRPKGDMPEAAIYGDYYYMEALMRKINPDWNVYW